MTNNDLKIIDMNVIDKNKFIQVLLSNGNLYYLLYGIFNPNVRTFSKYSPNNYVTNDNRIVYFSKYVNIDINYTIKSFEHIDDTYYILDTNDILHEYKYEGIHNKYFEIKTFNNVKNFEIGFVNMNNYNNMHKYFILIIFNNGLNIIRSDRGVTLTQICERIVHLSEHYLYTLSDSHLTRVSLLSHSIKPDINIELNNCKDFKVSGHKDIIVEYNNGSILQFQYNIKNNKLDFYKDLSGNDFDKIINTTSNEFYIIDDNLTAQYLQIINNNAFRKVSPKK